MLDNLNAPLDLNNIDPKQMVKNLIENKKLVRIILAVLSLLIIVWMFNDHRAKEQAMQMKISQAQAKLLVIKQDIQALADLNKFKSSLPKQINELELITMISTEANANHISITSLNPAKLSDMGLYNVINVSFSASADDFKSMMLFLRKMEKSDPPLRINSWSGQEQDGKISFTISLSAVLIHP